MLYYEAIENKKKDWVVFVHGIGGSILTWKKQIDDFSKYYNILLLDLNSHGNSQDTTLSKPYDYKDVCNGIKEILDTLKINKAHFVGLSLGTFILITYTILYPNTVNSLVMGGGVLKLEKSKLLLIEFVQYIKYLLPFTLLYCIFACILMPKKNHAKARKIFNREALKLKREEFLCWLLGLKQLRYADKYIDAINNLKDIRILYVMGNEDHMFLKSAKMTVIKLKTAELKIIEHCGHVCTIEKYKEFNRIALNFLAAL